MIFNKLIEEAKKAYLQTENTETHVDITDKQAVDSGARNYDQKSKNNSRNKYFDNSKSDFSGKKLADNNRAISRLAMELIATDDNFRNNISALLNNDDKENMIKSINHELDKAVTQGKDEEAQAEVEQIWLKNYEVILDIFDKFKQEVETVKTKLSDKFDSIVTAASSKNALDDMQKPLSKEAKLALQNPEYISKLGDIERQFVQDELNKYNSLNDKLNDMDSAQVYASLDNDPDALTAVLKSIVDFESTDKANPLSGIMSMSRDDVKERLDSFKNYLYDTQESQLHGTSKILNRFNSENFVTNLISKSIENSSFAQERLRKLQDKIKQSEDVESTKSVLGLNTPNKKSAVANQADQNAQRAANATQQAQQINKELDALVGTDITQGLGKITELLKANRSNYSGGLKQLNGIKRKIKSFYNDPTVQSQLQLQQHHINYIKSLMMTRDPENPFNANVVKVEESFDTIAESVLRSINSFDGDQFELDLREVFESIKKSEKITKK